MKSILYFESAKALSKSGIGRALEHQKKALASVGIDCSTDIKEYPTADIIHINTLFPKSYRILKKMKKAGKTVVVHGHSTYEDFRGSFRCWRLMEPFMDRFIRKMYTHADYIVTPTPYSRRLISGYAGVTCPVKAVSNGIDVEAYAYDQDAVDKFTSMFHLAPDAKVVIGIGWFFHRKGIEDFFEVARRLPDVTFIWFGHMGRLMTEHRILKSIKNRPDNCLMPGYIRGEVIKGALHFAKALLFPSREETEGIVVLEALASHLPVVVRDIGVYEGWLQDGFNCRMAVDVEGFAEVLKDIIANGPGSLLENGYKTACERTLDRIGVQLKSAYEEALKLKGNGNE